MTRRAAVQMLIAGLLIGWFVIFLRAENTEKSIVRAMLLEQSENGWSAGLLYQFPEASADASETNAQIQFVLASGRTPQAALMRAEKKLPRKANYRLCDYLLLGQESTLETLKTCESLFLEHPYGRLASHVFLLDFSGKALEFQMEENVSLPESLLEQIKSDLTAPRLYENRNGLLLPVLKLSDGELSEQEERLLITEKGKMILTEEQTQVILFLTGAKKTVSIQNDTAPFALTRLAKSIECEKDGFHLVLTCRCPPESRRPTQEEIRKWEALCTETIRLGWEQGSDLLRLSAVQALEDEMKRLTTKNACPQVRIDVVMF